MSSIHRELATLNEAVKTLKEQVKVQDEKLDAVRTDVTGAKAAGKVLWLVAVLVASIIGSIVTDYFHHHVLGASAK